MSVDRSAPLANVSLSIGGRAHVLAVAPDEEPHLRMLAQMIDERVRKLGMGQGQTEARMLLVAGLMLADELHTLQSVPNPAQPSPTPGPEPAETTPQAAQIPPELVAHVAALADRVEKLAARLEQSGEAS
jgi:cell division protein ZapA